MGSFIKSVFLSTLLWALMGSCAHAQTIVIFGDSLSAGYGLARGAGWVDLLTRRLQQQGLPHKVVNASISGETSAGGKARIARVLKQHQPAILLLALGANDGLRGHPTALLRANLAAIVTACKQRNTRVLLVGMRLPPNYGPHYARDFEAVFTTLAKQQSLPLVPFLLHGFAEQRQMFQSDGIHPNALAQPRILDTVWQPLRKMLP